MANRLRLVCIIAVSVLTSAALALGQSQNPSSTDLGYSGGLVPGAYQSIGMAPSLIPGNFASSFERAFAGAYAYPAGQSGTQQYNNGTQSQSQNGNQNQGTNGGQNQNQGNQGQGKETAPPPKPVYLTYTPKKKSLEEEAKSGKATAVDFKSAPVGAEVRVDGYYVGRTPTSAQIPFGKHLVSVTKWGYRPWIQEIDVTGKGSASVNPMLKEDW
ncbi:MAG: PEGA domain-containing protein [Acidobacteriota bacterium]